MKKILLAILTGLGIDATEANKLAELTDDQLKDWKGDTTIASIKTLMRNSLSNDQEFLNSIPEDKIPDATKKKIEKGQYARFQNELVEVATKELGLEDKELTDDDRKSIKKLAAKIATTYLTKKGNVEGLQKMQSDLAEARQQLTAKDTDWQTKLDAAVTTTTGKFNDKLIKTLVRSELSSMDKIKLNVSPAYLTDPVFGKISSKYKVILNDLDELDIRQKTNDTLDVIDKAGKKLTFGQALRDVVLEEKLGTEIKEETPPKNPPKKVIVDGSGEEGAVEVPSYIAEKVDTIIQQEAKA